MALQISEARQEVGLMVQLTPKVRHGKHVRLAAEPLRGSSFDTECQARQHEPLPALKAAASVRLRDSGSQLRRHTSGVRIAQQAMTRARKRSEKLKEAKFVMSVIGAIRATVNSTEWQQQRQVHNLEGVWRLWDPDHKGFLTASDFMTVLQRTFPESAPLQVRTSQTQLRTGLGQLFLKCTARALSTPS